MIRFAHAAALLAVMASPAQAADDDVFTFVQADRFEFVESSDSWVWDVQGWVGDDIRKLWVKAEGEYDGSAEENELQLLYSRAWTPFFDWQAGLRYDIDPTPSRAHLVVGVHGLAPQWFEIDSALFLSEEGDLTARFEAEYDLLLTQRMVLQPKLEIEVSANDVPELGIGSGLTSTELGLRLRYEVHRKFAPYVGVKWTRLHGRTAHFVADDDDLTALVGVRLWY